MAEKKEIMIQMDPSMAAKFAASTHVSSKWLWSLQTDLVYSKSSDEGYLREHAENELETPQNSGSDPGR